MPPSPRSRSSVYRPPATVAVTWVGASGTGATAASTRAPQPGQNEASRGSSRWQTMQCTDRAFYRRSDVMPCSAPHRPTVSFCDAVSRVVAPRPHRRDRHREPAGRRGSGRPRRGRAAPSWPRALGQKLPRRNRRSASALDVGADRSGPGLGGGEPALRVQRPGISRFEGLRPRGSRFGSRACDGPGRLLHGGIGPPSRAERPRPARAATGRGRRGLNVAVSGWGIDQMYLAFRRSTTGSSRRWCYWPTSMTTSDGCSTPSGTTRRSPSPCSRTMAIESACAPEPPQGLRRSRAR